MLTCFNVQKTHYFSNTVHYCSSSMPHLSNASFSTKPLLLTSTVCSDWPTDPVHCDWPNTTSTHRKCNAPCHNQVSFSSSSSPKGEQSRVTDTVMKLVCICSTQSVVKMIYDGLYTLLWCDPVPLTHTHTHKHTYTHTHTRCVTRKTPHLNCQ